MGLILRGNPSGERWRLDYEHSTLRPFSYFSVGVFVIGLIAGCARWLVGSALPMLLWGGHTPGKVKSMGSAQALLRPPERCSPIPHQPALG
jgi:hypothetical protein